MSRKINSQPDPEKMAFWRAKIEEQRTSGLTQADFCRQNNLTQNTFSFWKGVIFPEQRLAERKRVRRRRRIKVLSPYERDRLVKKWEKSGLTQAEFCRRENILEWEFSNWKARMINEKKKAAAAKLKKKSGFIEVKVEKEKATGWTKPVNGVASRVVAHIHFAGCSISILSEAEVADVKKIVTALMECANDRTH